MDLKKNHDRHFKKIKVKLFFKTKTKKLIYIN